jgi:BlaI family transcriptional regulator, penicillinase repressor
MLKWGQPPRLSRKREARAEPRHICLRRFSLTHYECLRSIVSLMTRSPQKPTASELEILRVLWARGPSTVREVHEALSERKSLGYTTVLKLLQIMTTKGTVRRNEMQRAHVYEACLPAEQTKRQFAGDMLQSVFEGSASQLMMHALAGKKASREEIEEIRRLLDEYERNRR